MVITHDGHTQPRLLSVPSFFWVPPATSRFPRVSFAFWPHSSQTTSMSRGEATTIVLGPVAGTMTFQSLPNRAREFFMLGETERAVRALPGEARDSVQREMELASQRRDAAETLWPRGSAAEALKLLFVALDGVSAALDALAARVEDRPEWLSRAVATVTDVRRQTAEVKPPGLEA